VNVVILLCITVFTIRYDTRCYFNVRSKANVSQLNLPHGIVSFIFLHKKKKNYRFTVACQIPPDHERSVLKTPENSDLDRFVVFMPKRRYDEPVNVIFVTESHIVG